MQDAHQPFAAAPNDRRSFVTSLFGLMAGSAFGICRPGDFKAVRAEPVMPSCTDTGPNGLVHLTTQYAHLAAAGDPDRLLGALEGFVLANREILSTSAVVLTLAERARANQLPTTIQDMYGVFQANWSPQGDGFDGGNICIEGPANCIDTGCDAKCSAQGWSGGDCWDVPGILEDAGLEPCECVCSPPWYEIVLLALIALILFATPGPDEIPATIAAISRYIVRAAPAIG